MERAVIAIGPWAADDLVLREAAESAWVELLIVPDARGARVQPSVWPPAALVIDSTLVGVGDLIYELRSAPETDLLPILAVVPAAHERAVVDALRIGADDFVVADELASQLPSKLRAAVARTAEPHSPGEGKKALLADGSELHRMV